MKCDNRQVLGVLATRPFARSPDSGAKRKDISAEKAGSPNPIAVALRF